MTEEQKRKAAEAARRFRAKRTPEYLERERLRRASKKAERAEYDRKRRRLDPEYFTEKMRRYRRNNQQYLTAYLAARRAHIRLIDETEPGYWNDVIRMHGDKCLKCGGSPVTLDHVVPVSKGGRHHVSNFQPLCLPCNSGKCDREVDYRISNV